MSINVSRAVWERSRTKGAARLVLLAIADHADETGFAFPGLERLATFTRLDLRTVTRGIRRIEKAGEIAVQRRPGRVHRYQVLVAPPAGSHPRQEVTPGRKSGHPRQDARGTPGRMPPHPRQDAGGIIKEPSVESSSEPPHTARAKNARRSRSRQLAAGKKRTGRKKTGQNGIEQSRPERRAAKSAPPEAASTVVTAEGMQPAAPEPEPAAVAAELVPPEAVDFETFWQAYPRRLKKTAARRAWERLAPSPDLAAMILAAVERLRGTIEWQREGGRFVPAPADFLANERWEDACDVPYHPDGTVENVAAAQKAIAMMRRRREDDASENGYPPDIAAKRRGYGLPT